MTVKGFLVAFMLGLGTQSPLQRADPGDVDLSHITKLASLGESYSVGVGAGDRLGTILDALDDQGDWSCSRYDRSHPYLVSQDPRLGKHAGKNFQFRACSGATIADVLTTQLPRVDPGQQVIMISSGGNDAELFNLLNQCIYQFASLMPDKVQEAIEETKKNDLFGWAADYDFEPLGRGCEDQLRHTANIIASQDFDDMVDRLINAAKLKLAPDGMIYYTGYAKFFSEDYTSECDKVSWSIWDFKPNDIFRPPVYLTTRHRQVMNVLVDRMNYKLKQAVHRAGPQVNFVNYDRYVGHFNGRYCEPGVDESTTESNNRTELMFYELNVWGAEGENPKGRSPWGSSLDGIHENSFYGGVNIMAQITKLLDKEVSGRFTSESFRKTGPNERLLVANLPQVKFAVHNIVPDGYSRIFHPQVSLHRIIAGLILDKMTKHNALDTRKARSSGRDYNSA